MIITLIITRYLPILCVIAAVTNSQKSETVVNNKNVNIIMNLDAKQIAQELWNLMKNRLNNSTNDIKETIIEDLKNAVLPAMNPTRRGMSPVYAYQVANKIDDIIRATYIRNNPAMDMLDVEIMTRNTVANMMSTLKTLLSNKFAQAREEKNEMATSGRRMLYSTPKKDDYVDIKIKMRRKDIFNALQ